MRRKGTHLEGLGLSADDYVTAQAVVERLPAHPERARSDNALDNERQLDEASRQRSTKPEMR